MHYFVQQLSKIITLRMFYNFIEFVFVVQILVTYRGRRFCQKLNSETQAATSAIAVDLISLASNLPSRVASKKLVN